MDGLLGKLKQAVSPSHAGGQPKAPSAPVDPSVTRIDLKTASHEDVVIFVKRQNKHIQQLETLLERLELRHKDYKDQLRDYADQITSLRSLEHIKGDEDLKKQLSVLLVEKDALTAELHLEHEKQRLQAESSPPLLPDTTESSHSILSEQNQRLQSELDASNAKIIENQSTHEHDELKLKETIEMHKSELLRVSSQLNQANAACEALKSRLNQVTTQHSTQLQSLKAEHSNQLQVLNATILKLQDDLEKIKVAQEKTKTSNSVSSLPQSSTGEEAMDSIISERDTLQIAVDYLTAEVEALKGQLSEISSAASPPPTSTAASPSVSENTSQKSESDPLSNPNYQLLQEKIDLIKTLEGKLQSKHSLLVKAHKHLGELTAQLADANIRVEQLHQEKARWETSTASLVALREKNAQLEASLEESLREFEEYKVKVAGAVSQQSQAEAPTPAASSSETPAAIQEKIESLLVQLDQLQKANVQLRTTNDASTAENNLLRSKLDSATSQLRHIKEKEPSRSQVSEKHQTELRELEERHQTTISTLKGQLESNAVSATSQLSKLRSKVDEAIKQKDSEISMLKDTIEVLKMQVSESEPKRTSSGSIRPTEMSSETSRRRVDVEGGLDSTARKQRLGEQIHRTRTPSPSRPSSSSAEPSFSGITQREWEDQSSQVQNLLTRLKASQEQVSELEQLLVLSREQEQFLKLELRRSDRPTSPSPASSSHTRAGGHSPHSDFSASNEFFILRNLLKNMLETREIPNVSVLADLLRFTPEEIDQIQARASNASNVSNVVNNGINAIWNVFGSPQRR